MGIQSLSFLRERAGFSRLFSLISAALYAILLGEQKNKKLDSQPFDVIWPGLLPLIWHPPSMNPASKEVER
jgi:hypothetical protein